MSGADDDLLALRPQWLTLAEAVNAALAAVASVEDRCQARYPARPRWEHGDSEDPRLVAPHEAAMARHCRARNKIEALEGLSATRDREREAVVALRACVDKIATKPACTLAGLRFKAEVSCNNEHMSDELAASIAADVLALA